MNAVVEGALDLWGMGGADYRLIAARENQVFRVDYKGASYAMRFHRPDYRTDAELWSELQWMEAVAKGGLSVPVPVQASGGELLKVVGGVQVDMLNWLPGAPAGSTRDGLQVADRTGFFRRLGREMARLHTVTDGWTPPPGFTRCAWDRAGLLGPSPLWDRFWENPTLSAADQDLLLTARRMADEELQKQENTLDYGLIHADLIRENVMTDGEALYLIDFDDSGFGFRLFDLATTLVRNMQEPDYPALRAALLAGYSAERALDLSALDLFILLRSFTYVGWIIKRMVEDGAEQRNKRFISQARNLALTYVGG